MKKVLSLILTCCLIFAGLIFSSCGVSDIKLKDLPAYEDSIYGNGGMVVTKGNYVYFASGYVASDKLGKTFSNIKGTVTNGALYRAKMVTTIDEEKEILEDVQLMVSKIVGFEKGGLYIFKDKIYFATPSIVQDKTGVRYDLLTFYSCNLDGSELTEFYQTDEFGSSAKYSMTMIDKDVYLLIYTGTKILKINESKIITEMADNVTQVSLPVRENILNNEENPVENERYIYYTKKTESEDPNLTINLGNSLYRKNIATNEEVLLYQDYSIEKGYAIEINLISITAGRLFYKHNTKFTTTQYYYSNSLSGEDFASSESQHNFGNANSFIALGEKNNTNLGVAFIFNDKLFVKGLNQGINEMTEIDVLISTTLVAKNGYIYYVYSNDLYRVNITSNDPAKEVITGNLTPLKTMFDIDNNYCYFFIEDTEAVSGYSLYRIALEGLVAETSVAEKMN